MLKPKGGKKKDVFVCAHLEGVRGVAYAALCHDTSFQVIKSGKRDPIPNPPHGRIFIKCLQLNLYSTTYTHSRILVYMIKRNA